jgi:Phage tail tube protein, GTA-gp10
MANPVKGEVPIDIEGKRYTLVLNTFALAAVEQRLGMQWTSVFKKAADGEFGIQQILALFHAALMKHHRRITEEEAANLIDEAGLPSINEALGQAVRLMQPFQNAGGEEPANPPKINGGVGTISSQNG